MSTIFQTFHEVFGIVETDVFSTTREHVNLIIVSLYINCKETYTVSLCFPQTLHCVTNAIFYFSASLIDRSLSILIDL